MRGRHVALLVAAVASLAGTSLAQPDDNAVRAARELGNEGIELYERGDYTTALDKLERAYGVIQAPTLGLWSARALVKAGKLVEASERYLAVARSTPKDDDPAVFAESRALATTEYEALQPRLPTLVVTVDGASAENVVVSVDGKQLDANLLGVPVAFNPGARQVRAQQGDEVVSQTVTLKEGEPEALVMRFAATGPVAEPSVGTASTATATPTHDAGPASATTAGSSLRPWGYVALGVGGVGLVTGTVAHLLAKGKERDLEALCEGERCSTAAEGDIDSYDRLTTVAPVGTVIGVVGVAAGVTLLLVTPKPSSAQQRSVAPFVGWGHAGVKGVF